MNKTEIVDAIASELEISKNKASEAFDLVFNSIKKAVAENIKVSIPDFGAFEQRERSARKGRNPQTGAEIDIPASKAVGFKVAKKFKDKLAQG